MNRKEYLKAIDEVIYLSGCVINGAVPDGSRIEDMDIALLYQAACDHYLAAIVGFALESVGIKDHDFSQAKAKSIRKVTVMEIDRERLFSCLEHEGIWYMPLKGSVIKSFYPSVGLRQMSDNDILFDKAYAERVRDIMLGMGYTCEVFDGETHDVYHKEPVCNFELHTALFGDSYNKEICEYYLNVKDRLIRDEGRQYGYHFSSNDLYIYLLCHEYKHYSHGGTGLRSLLDTYVIWKKLGNELDEEYIRSECEKLGISDFEQKNRQLALSLFGGDGAEYDSKLLEYFAFSGTYGNIQNVVKNSVSKNGGGKKGKRRYILDQLFLPMSTIKLYYPVFYRHKILLPGLFVYRILKAVTVKRKTTLIKLKTLNNIEN